MPYTRRPTRPDQPARRDYVIRRDDLQIGRVYLTKRPTATASSGRSTQDHSESTGRADQRLGGTLDKATAAMLKSYGQMRAKAGLPQPQPN